MLMYVPSLRLLSVSETVSTESRHLSSQVNEVVIAQRK